MRTFDIRFEKSLGLAGLFEAPANPLGWKGPGKLSIDAQGIRIAAKRGLLTLFSPGLRQFSADSLTEVYREGDSLRLVFGGRDRRETLAVWTRGGAAAEIVKLLPTLRTVELEHSTDTRRYQFDWRATSMVFLLAVMLVAGTMLVLGRFAVEVSQLAEPKAKQMVETLPGTTSNERETVVNGPAGEQANSRVPAPIPQISAATQPREAYSDAVGRSNVSVQSDSQPADAVAGAGPVFEDEPAGAVEAAPYVPPRYFGTYATEISLLRYDYYNWKGRVTAEGLGALENRWWELTVLIYHRSSTGVDYGPSLEAKALAISRAWRNHLALYAESLRSGDQSLMAGAQAEVELAEQLSKEVGW